jgi:hypothetical protein
VKWALGTVAIVAAVVGCGGSHTSNRAAILAALKASPTTYLHYTSRSWGHQLGIVTQVQVNGEHATALITGRHLLKERVSLRRHQGVWRITSDGGGVINGSRAERPATASELTAISTVAEHAYPQAKGCITYAAHISTLNPQYAEVDYVYPKAALDNLRSKCARFVGNGVDIYVHAGTAGWRHLISGDQFQCNDAPPGVVRSLFGSCLLPNA